jgi:hypothetical protein
VLTVQLPYRRQYANYDESGSEGRPLKLTKTLKVLIIEAGMLGGIVVAALIVPYNTPLKAFLIASAGIFLLGNVVLIRGLRSWSSAEGSKGNASPQMKLWSLLAAVWCWGAALTSFIGTTMRIVLGIIGTAAFLWYMREKRKTLKP